MKKVIVFFNTEPVTLDFIPATVATVIREYPDGDQIYLSIMQARAPSITGDREEVWFAADREVTSREIQDAMEKLY
ncbi:hypothetical protein GIX45_13615 [Erwinia sp. CPCC 100877]|nr:hypothetical protein [Erwinia sp. CPCC 100877]